MATIVERQYVYTGLVGSSLVDNEKWVKETFMQDGLRDLHQNVARRGWTVLRVGEVTIQVFPVYKDKNKRGEVRKNAKASKSVVQMVGRFMTTLEIPDGADGEYKDGGIIL